MHRLLSTTLAALVAAGVTSTVHAQAASAPTTPSNLPPGATSATGNKAATPASGTMPADPQTGSTPGMPPGARSATGNKAETPKSGMSRAASAAGAASKPAKGKDGRVQGSREKSMPTMPASAPASMPAR